MPYSPVEICNFAGSKLGGFGDQIGASGQITALNATDSISVWANSLWPKARRKVIGDLVVMKCPIRETVKYVELDENLPDNDFTISDIAVGTAPNYVVTITTDEAHERATGDTVVLKGIDGDGGISMALNGLTKIITVTSTTAFTLNQYAAWVTATPYALGALVSNGGSYYRCLVAHTAGVFATDLSAGDWTLTQGATHYATTGDSGWDYTEDSGLVSDAPELGPYTYAFDLPSDCLTVVRVTDESFSSDEDTRRDYRFSVMRNRDDDGWIIATNDVTNADADGIYLEYCIDPPYSDTDGSTDTIFNDEVCNAMAQFLASELAPVAGRNSDVRMAMLAEYKNYALPDAASYNETQINLTAKKRTDFRGGRSALPNSL